jgi:hypothetical protein
VETHAPTTRERRDMAWNLDGSYFESCSCEVICPCTGSLSFGATYDRCQAALVFNVENGDIEGTEVGGNAVAAIADTPKVMSEGNWRLGLLIDEDATDEQTQKLAAVFSGSLGGPMGALAPLVGKNLGMERARIEVEEDGVSHSVKVGDAIDLEVEDIVPFGVENGQPAKLTGIFHPVGSELTVAHATRSNVDAFGLEFETKAGF